ncbi:MAG: hypothetical protein GY820_15535 [Gammaproteobacteria bacterium]|nr:hypothetical protein [Gammaproteobacteria bacterium]
MPRWGWGIALATSDTLVLLGGNILAMMLFFNSSQYWFITLLSHMSGGGGHVLSRDCWETVKMINKTTIVFAEVFICPYTKPDLILDFGVYLPTNFAEEPK